MSADGVSAPAVNRLRPVLVTGGAGFIGCNLADRLAREGHDVVVYDGLARAGGEHNRDRQNSPHPPPHTPAPAALTTTSTAPAPSAAAATTATHPPLIPIAIPTTNTPPLPPRNM